MRSFILPLLLITQVLTPPTTTIARSVSQSGSRLSHASALHVEIQALRQRAATLVPDSGSSGVAGTLGPGRVCTPTRDDFSTSTLAQGWTWTDPNDDVLASLESRSGYLRISTNADNNNNLNPAGNMNGPRLLRPLTADTHVIRTSVSVTTVHDFQGAGLLLWHDAANFAWLHRTLGVDEPGIYFALAVSNVMTYTMAAASPNDVELQIMIEDGTINGYWQAEGLPWQFVGGGVVTGSLSGGVNLVADFGSPGILADFAFFESHTCKMASSMTFLPLAGKADAAVRGAVTLNGIPASGVEVLLRQYRPDETSTAPVTIATTTTTINGTYRFENAPASPVGYARYVLFRNPSQSADGRLLAFEGDDLPRAGGAAVPPIDIADIALGTPYDPQYVVEISTPVQFNWQPRSTSLDDSYRLWLDEPAGNAFFASPHLGSAGSYVLQTRPPGFVQNPSYYLWYATVDTAGRNRRFFQCRRSGVDQLTIDD
jgi:Beta xylosidase C-terminal Concanavalin A-like domain